MPIRWITLFHHHSAYDLRCVDIQGTLSQVHLIGERLECILTGDAALAFWQAISHALQRGGQTIRLRPRPKELVVRLAAQEQRTQQEGTINDAHPNHLYLCVPEPAKQT